MDEFYKLQHAKVSSDQYHFANVINSGKLRPGLMRYREDLEKEFKLKYKNKLGEQFFEKRARSSKHLK